MTPFGSAPGFAMELVLILCLISTGYLIARLFRATFSTLLNNTSQSLSLVAWLLSRSRLRIYNSSMILSKASAEMYLG